MKLFFSTAYYLVLFSSLVFASVKRKTDKDINVESFNFCSCDMTSHFCDIYCCCDQDCTDLQKQVFDCKNKSLKNNYYSWRCGTFTVLPGHEFQDFLCVEKENSPYIGMYFENFSAIKDLPSLNNIINLRYKDKVAGSISENHKIETILPKLSTYDKGYIYGKNLLIKQKDSQLVNLSVPNAVYSHHCDSEYPVQYLKDISLSCVVDVKEACSSTKSSSSLNIEQFTLNGNVRKLLASPDNELALEDINTSFYYYEHLCCYFHNCDTSVVCTKNMFSFNPYFFSNKTVCHNSVVGVNYTFEWHSGQILSARVDVLLQNITILKTLFVPQIFRIEFLHQENYTAEIKKNGSLSNFLVRSSYEINTSLISLVNMSIEEDNFAENETLQIINMNTLASRSDGSCVLNDKGLKFGINIMSGCYFQILPNSSSCYEIRSDVSKLLNQVLDAHGVCSGRNLEFGQFIKIDRVLYNENDTQQTLNSRWNVCYNVPYHVHLEVTYAKFGEINRQPLFWIIGAERRYNTSTLFLSPPYLSTIFPLYSTVSFKYVSLEEENILKNVKRFLLSNTLLSHCKEETCWEEILYPLTNVLRGFESQYRLSVARNALLLTFILIFSCWFLFRIRNFHETLSYNKNSIR